MTIQEIFRLAAPYLFSLIAGYLAGSINAAFFIAKKKGFDIREKGSGNAGTTNAGRTMGPAVAAGVATCDILKCALMVFLANYVFPDSPCIGVATAFACFFGHLFPFYLEFRGGKGIAVLLGSALALDWRLCFIMIAWILIMSVVTDYMFLASTSASLGYFLWFLFTGRSWPELVLMGIMVVAVFWHHRTNFGRFFAKKELGMRNTFFGDACRVESAEGEKPDSEPSKDENT